MKKKINQEYEIISRGEREQRQNIIGVRMGGAPDKDGVQTVLAIGRLYLSSYIDKEYVYFAGVWVDMSHEEVTM